MGINLSKNFKNDPLQKKKMKTYFKEYIRMDFVDINRLIYTTSITMKFYLEWLGWNKDNWKRISRQNASFISIISIDKRTFTQWKLFYRKIDVKK